MKSISKKREAVYSKELEEWDLNSRFHKSDRIHPYRVLLWETVLADFKIEMGKKRILEVGCGGGFFTGLLRRRDNWVYGVDFSPEMIQIARKNSPMVSFQVASAEKLPFKNVNFDIVFACMLFHHLEVQGLLPFSIREVTRVLKRGGSLCVLDHSGNFLSRATLYFFSFFKEFFVLFKGRFSSSGSSHEIPFDSYKFIDSLKKDFAVVSIQPVSTIFFQLFSVFSHGIEYLFGEERAVFFEKVTLPLLTFFEKAFSSRGFCTEVAFKLEKKE